MYEVYGFAACTMHVDFVIADALIDKATEVLLTKPPLFAGNVRRCSPAELCMLPITDPYYHHSTNTPPWRPPHVHLHTDYSDVCIRLWKQSLTLWAMPSLAEMPIPKPGAQFKPGKLALELAPNYTVASHPRFPKKHTNRHVLNSEKTGRYPPDLHKVIILLPERGFETAMRMWARYLDHRVPEAEQLNDIRVEAWMIELKLGKPRIIDIDLIMPQLRVMAKIALHGDITRRQMRVVVRQILGEPAIDQRFETVSFLDDLAYNDDPSWKLDRDDHLCDLTYGGQVNIYGRRWNPKKKKPKKEHPMLAEPAREMLLGVIRRLCKQDRNHNDGKKH